MRRPSNPRRPSRPSQPRSKPCFSVVVVVAVWPALSVEGAVAAMVVVETLLSPDAVIAGEVGLVFPLAAGAGASVPIVFWALASAAEL